MITFNQIRDSDPLLIVYPGGTGGEFVSNILSQCSSSFNALPNKYNDVTNRIEVVSPLNFQHSWLDYRNTDTWISSEFEHRNNNLRYVLRLHPDVGIVNSILTHMPDIEIMYMTPLSQSEYFSKLLFIKIAHIIDTPINAIDLNKGVTASLSNTDREIVSSWINSIPDKIWSIELGDICHIMKNGKDLRSFNYSKSPMQYVRKYMYSMHLSFYNTCQHFEHLCKKLHIVCSDSLASDGVQFWNTVQTFIPDLDMSTVLDETNKWINKNNTIITKFDNDNNIR